MTVIFQLPSAPFLKPSMNLPLSATRFPSASLRLNSYVPIA